MRRACVVMVVVSIVAATSSARARSSVSIADGDTTGLIAAILAANANPGTDTISLAPNGTYTIAAPFDGNNGLPPLDDVLVVNGNGATILRSYAAGTPDFRILQVQVSGIVTFVDVAIENGRHTMGAGILNFGSTSLIASSLRGNAAVQFGGGAFNWPGATLTVLNSTVSHNTANLPGCPSCSYGGGINSWGFLTVVNSTIANNATGFGGGGVYAHGNALVINTTIANNHTTTHGAGVFVESSGRITIRNSILAANVSSSLGSMNCRAIGPFNSLGSNLSDDGSCASFLTQPGDVNGLSAGLDPLGLQDNGGPTLTIALTPGSPAIGKADLAVCAASPVGGIDQRGNARPNGVGCDIGAFEATVVVPDTSAPTIACGAPDGAWHGTDVSILCSASDGGSGLLNSSDASFALVASVAGGVETANASTNSRAVCDNAGNCATAGPVAGNMIDKRGPTITLVSPVAMTYQMNQLVPASFSCTDGGSGVAACTGTVPNGTAIDTGSVGARSFAVTATDNAGNAGVPVIVSYKVAYGFSGFFAPVDNLPAINTNKAGSAIPLKFSLGGNFGLNILSAGSPSLQQIDCSAGTPIGAPTAANTAGGSSLSYDAITDRYTYVWKSEKGWANTCRQLVLTLADGSAHLARVAFK